MFKKIVSIVVMLTFAFPALAGYESPSSKKQRVESEQQQERIVNLKAGNNTDMWIYYDRNTVLVTSSSKYFKKQWRFLKEGQNLKIGVKFTNSKVKYKRGDFEWVKPAQIQAVTIKGINYIQVTDAQVSELELDVANYMVIATKTGFNYWWQRINLTQVN